MDKETLLPCPFCGNKNLHSGAFSLSEDCFISCDCGAMVELQIPWGDMTQDEHDDACKQALEKAWNRRTNDERD